MNSTPQTRQEQDVTWKVGTTLCSGHLPKGTDNTIATVTSINDNAGTALFLCRKKTTVQQADATCTNGNTPFKIIASSNSGITTHQLTSGALTIGLTDKGGGVINQVIMPGKGDIMDVQTDKYGRAGQSAIRDNAHGRVYNPTQGGFRDHLGTQCHVTTAADRSLIVDPRPVALWHGDRNYDFIEWENSGPDPYGGDGGHGDLDGLDESNLVGKQEAEITSEFDYYGTYEDFMGKYGIATPAIRHYFEYRFIRPPGHALEQFRRGTPKWRGHRVSPDISRNSPQGIHRGTDKDMNGLIVEWTLRHDVAKWAYTFVFYRKTNGQWDRTDSSDSSGTLKENSDGTAVILADFANPAKGVALGLYHPNSPINVYSIVGVNDQTGKIVYQDNRLEHGSTYLNPYRIPVMSKYGFMRTYSGMLNRTRLPQHIFETFRNEVYILSGTPQDVMNAIALLDKALIK